MGRIANVTKALFDRRGAAAGKAVIVETEAAGGETRTAETYHPPGVSSAPTPKDKAAVLEIRAGGRVVVATHNYRTPVEAKPGQTIIYSTNADGSQVMSQVDMQDDGTIIVTNDGDAETTVNTDGTYTVANANTDLKTVLDSLIDELVAFRTAGSPTQHTTDPGTVANLQTIKTQLAQLLK